MTKTSILIGVVITIELNFFPGYCFYDLVTVWQSTLFLYGAKHVRLKLWTRCKYFFYSYMGNYGSVYRRTAVFFYTRLTFGKPSKTNISIYSLGNWGGGYYYIILKWTHKL